MGHGAILTTSPDWGPDRASDSNSWEGTRPTLGGGLAWPLTSPPQHVSEVKYQTREKGWDGKKEGKKKWKRRKGGKGSGKTEMSKTTKEKKQKREIKAKSTGTASLDVGGEREEKPSRRSASKNEESKSAAGRPKPISQHGEAEHEATPQAPPRSDRS